MNLPGSLSMGVLQARILEWVAMPSSRESSHPRDQIQVPLITDRLSDRDSSSLRSSATSVLYPLYSGQVLSFYTWRNQCKKSLKQHAQSCMAIKCEARMSFRFQGPCAKPLCYTLKNDFYSILIF